LTLSFNFGIFSVRPLRLRFSDFFSGRWFWSR
jgi:hypothetical protein